jgi:hypothetical protein
VPKVKDVFLLTEHLEFRDMHGPNGIHIVASIQEADAMGDEQYRWTTACAEEILKRPQPDRELIIPITQKLALASITVDLRLEEEGDSAPLNDGKHQTTFAAIGTTKVQQSPTHSCWPLPCPVCKV